MSDRVKAILYPSITFVVLLALWKGAIEILEVPNYLLPTPESVVNALHQAYIEGTFWPHAFYTLKAMAIGYAIGCTAALVLGGILAESRTFELFVYPYFVALQSMPKVALAPLLIVWLGFDLAPKIVMVALVCFFPLFINTVVGIRQTSPALVDLMHAFSGSRLRTFLVVKLPAAASHIFAGLQIGVVLSLIGAVVGEFVASSKGLGYIVKSASVGMEVNVMFAALISLAFIGVTASMAVRALHRAVIFWERGSTQTAVVA